MTTERSEQASIRLGCLLGISRGGATGFTDLYIENEWLGNPHSFVKISEGRSMTRFCLPFHAGNSASPELVSWRAVREERAPVNPFRKTFRNSKQDETEYREKRYSQLHK